jgi:hypothetical protein
MAKRKARVSTDRDKSFRETYPKQISGRVTTDTYDQIEALRDTLHTHTGDIIRQGAEAVVKLLSTEDRRYFNDSLARIRRRRQQSDGHAASR